MMRGRWITAALCAALAAAPAPAQTLDRPDTAAQRSPRLFVRRDLYVAGAFVAGTVAMVPLDRKLADALQDSSVQANGLLKSGATGARLIGSPGALIISGGMFAAGRVLKAPRLADMGLHTFESVVMAEGITRALKGVAGRERPYASPNDAVDYRLGGGFGDADRRSMPSGHTTAAFAAAAAGTSEVGHWWPRRRTLAAVTLYSLATLTGVSRMYNNKHWASDVVVGAGIGAFSGWKVVGYTHAHPDNRVDRWLLRTRVAPAAGGGMSFAWSSLTR
jgi:membrane-associated phospholipid phosphatase